MILKILGTIDIAIGFTLLFHGILSPLSFIFGIAALLKGIYSLASSISSGYYYDLMGLLDLAAGLSLLTGFGIPFLWILLLLKGIFSWL